MFGSEIIDVAIALVFVYFLMSLICSAIMEYIAGKRKLRAKMLKDGIRCLLSNSEKAEQVIKHSLFRGITQDKRKKEKIEGKEEGPSELSAKNFALILFDTLMYPTQDKKDENTNPPSVSIPLSKNGDLIDVSKNTIHTIEEALKTLGEGELKNSLTAMLNSAKLNVEKTEDVLAEFQSSIEKWFDDAMVRVSGWYKRKTQFFILGIALIACLIINVDTFVIADSFFQDSTLRENVIASVEKRLEQGGDIDDEVDVVKVREELNSLQLPIWWNADTGVKNQVPDDFGGWLIKLLGIVVSALAISLGAPFWFDLLNKLVNIRSSGKKPKQGEETPSIAVVNNIQP